MSTQFEEPAERILQTPPSGDPDRGPSGRFARGNTAAFVVGERSEAFRRAVAAVRAKIRATVIADAGSSEHDAPTALQAAAEGTAQAVKNPNDMARVRLTRDLRVRLEDWQALLGRHVDKSRLILRQLFISRVVLRPTPMTGHIPSKARFRSEIC